MVAQVKDNESDATERRAAIVEVKLSEAKVQGSWKEEGAEKLEEEALEGIEGEAFPRLLVRRRQASVQRRPVSHAG